MRDGHVAGGAHRRQGLEHVGEGRRMHAETHVHGVEPERANGGVVHRGRERVRDRVAQHSQQSGVSADLHSAAPGPAAR